MRETAEIEGFRAMIRILFICHGNICRSTMAQFVMEDMINKKGLQDKVYVDSAATSTEEIGNPPHRGTVRKMNELGIPMRKHFAVRLTRADYDKYDYLIGMDEWNYRNILNIVGPDKDNKVSLLLDFTDRPGPIADPWYTNNFDKTYEDVAMGCEGLLLHILDKLNNL